MGALGNETKASRWPKAFWRRRNQPLVSGLAGARPLLADDLRPRPAQIVHKRYAKNSTIPVSRLYIEPTIFMLPLDSRSRSTELFFRMLAIVSDTFSRATASTNA